MFARRRNFLTVLLTWSLAPLGGCSQGVSELPGPGHVARGEERQQRYVSSHQGTADALSYLANEMDVHHRVTVVYDDLESGGERFVPSGWMRGRGGERLEWDEDAKKRLSVTHVEDVPRAGPTCLRVHWQPRFDDEWVALNWQRPEDNWGQFEGLNLAGAKAVTWFVRGKTGREVIDFKFGATKDDNQPHGDSSETLVRRVTLPTEWAKGPYRIDLAGDDTSSVVSGFSVAISALDNPRGCEFYLDEILIDRPRLDEPRLVRSYRVGDAPLQGNWQLRNTCFVYDNALVICAFLSSPNAEHHKRAALIADALVALAAAEGGGTRAAESPLRLRNAYACGDLFGRYRANGYAPTPRLPGWLNRGNEPPPALAPWLVDAYSQGTDSGNMAWACLALLNCWERTSNNKYLDTAKRLASWVIQHCSRGNLSFGFTGGVIWDPKAGQERDVPWQSTEHNIDLSAVFRRLREQAEKQGDPQQEVAKWKSAEDSATRFVQWALQQGGDHLVTGTDNERAAPAMDPKPLDPQCWSVLAFPGDMTRYAPALEWAARPPPMPGTCYIWKEDGIWGYGFSTVSKDIWPEGTGQVVVARKALGQATQAQAVLRQLDEIQQRHAKRKPAEAGAIPAAYPRFVETGFPQIFYQDYAHVGATAWYVMAKTGWNPFTGKPCQSGAEAPRGR